jgi:hypothetical protein
LTPAETQGKKEVLFEIEEQNLFKDPIVDTSYAAGILAMIDNTVTTRVRDKLKHQNEIFGRILTEATTSISPIDQAFEARNVLSQRQEVQGALLPGR